MCLVASSGIELAVRDVHVVVAELTAAFSAALMGSERMAFWSGSVAAAEAKKVEDASMHVLLTPRPPICTGKLACDHCLSESSTLRTRDSSRLRVSSYDANKGLSKHGEVLRT